jgi:hypothetical protein
MSPWLNIYLMYRTMAPTARGTACQNIHSCQHPLLPLHCRMQMEATVPDRLSASIPRAVVLQHPLLPYRVPCRWKPRCQTAFQHQSPGLSYCSIRFYPRLSHADGSHGATPPFSINPQDCRTAASGLPPHHPRPPTGCDPTHTFPASAESKCCCSPLHEASHEAALLSRKYQSFYFHTAWMTPSDAGLHPPSPPQPHMNTSTTHPPLSPAPTPIVPGNHALQHVPRVRFRIFPIIKPSLVGALIQRMQPAR